MAGDSTLPRRPAPGRMAGAGRIAAAVLALVWQAPPRAAAAEPSIGIVTLRPQPMMANLGDDYRSIYLGTDRDAYEHAAGALAEHQTLEFRKTPLRDAAATVAEKAGTAIGFDHAALDDASVDIDAATVSGSFEGVSLRAAFRELLGDMDLDLVFRNGRLVVTTGDAARRHVVRFFYPVLAGTDLEELAALVERTVSPDSWDGVGGIGAIAPLPAQLGSGLVISQTEAVHEEIAGLLRGLDAALWNADTLDDDVEPRLVRAYAVADPVVREAAAENLVGICNGALPHGADPEATVDVIGESLVVRARSRAFHVMAAQVLSAVQGVDMLMIEGDDVEGDDEFPAAPAAAPDAHATGFRGAAWPHRTPRRR